MFRYKLSDWVSEHKGTTGIGVLGIITVIYSFFSNGLSGHYWGKVLGAIIFYAVLGLIVFLYEHANVVADPDTKENKLYKNMSLIVFIVAFIGICIYGHYVMSFW